MELTTEQVEPDDAARPPDDYVVLPGVDPGERVEERGSDLVDVCGNHEWLERRLRVVGSKLNRTFTESKLSERRQRLAGNMGRPKRGKPHTARDK